MIVSRSQLVVICHSCLKRFDLSRAISRDDAVVLRFLSGGMNCCSNPNQHIHDMTKPCEACAPVNAGLLVSNVSA